ncbi:MAG: hypothetical protein ABSG23_00065 [Terriglobales bacterium]
MFSKRSNGIPKQTNGFLLSSPENLKTTILELQSSLEIAMDASGQFTNVGFNDSLAETRRQLELDMRDWAGRPDAQYEQGDERGRPLNFFEPVIEREQFNPAFAAIREGEGYSPARELMSAMMYYYEDPDGNFVEQFQSTGFDAHLWELYLFATLTEIGYSFDRAHAAPDFLCSGILGEFFVEAVTVGSVVWLASESS